MMLRYAVPAIAAGVFTLAAATTAMAVPGGHVDSGKPLVVSTVADDDGRILCPPHDPYTGQTPGVGTHPRGHGPVCRPQEPDTALIPCPTDWNPLWGHGPVCRPQEPDTALIPCPTDWNPLWGHGPVCRPQGEKSDPQAPARN